MSTALSTQLFLCLITPHCITWQQVLLSHCLVSQWAPPTSNHLSMSDHYLSCSAIGQCCSGPRPQATTCQSATLSCPAQLLVSAAVGLAYRQLSVRDHWGNDSVKGQWCGGHQVESEVRGRFRPAPKRPYSSPSLGPVGELEGPGTDWGIRPAGIQHPH